MDPRPTLLLFVALLAIAAAGIAVSIWGIWAWSRTPAGRSMVHVEAGMRVVSFRLAQMEGKLSSLQMMLQAEAARTMRAPELEELLARVHRPPLPAPPAPEPQAVAPITERVTGSLPRSTPIPASSPPAKSWVQVGPRSRRGGTIPIGPMPPAPPPLVAESTRIALAITGEPADPTALTPPQGVPVVSAARKA